ncbi:polyphosphate glucokinase [Clavibacter michiganensis]|uniref:polyphosphate--glucose phosphotransferase n=1 Tax=Clavibacter michiganensis TaxID=28447 RepID=UPI0019562FD7|nr:ROK family protein [Clavibacter michiganensis]MBM7410810.1 polyphosphate glucokinase [Clavibacter michiganensis]
MSDDATTAIGIDIGGTGIKGAIVDVATGELRSERVKLPTPQGGEPDDIVATVKQIIDALGEVPAGTPLGVCFPAAIVHGTTMSAANVSPSWIGLEAEKLFEERLGLEITFVNDADAAGYAEARYGAAKDVRGLVIMTTLGTGIGTALIHDGVLIPNAELGHMDVAGRRDFERRASYAAKERAHLNWKRWAARLQVYYGQLEKLMWPELFIVGGGVSKNHKHFLPLLRLRTPIVPAELRNNAGIMGAAALAAHAAGAVTHAPASDLVDKTKPED